MMLREYLFSPRVAYVGLALLGLASLAVLFAVDPRYPRQLPHLPVSEADRLLLPRLRHAARPAQSTVRRFGCRFRLQSVGQFYRCHSSPIRLPQECYERSKCPCRAPFISLRV